MSRSIPRRGILGRPACGDARPSCRKGDWGGVGRLPDGQPQDAADAPVPASAGSALNPEQLAMLQEAGGGPGLLAELAELFVDDVPPRLDVLRNAVGRVDGETLLRAAHSLEGRARTLGADEMAEPCRQMDRRGR